MQASLYNSPIYNPHPKQIIDLDGRSYYWQDESLDPGAYSVVFWEQAGNPDQPVYKLSMVNYQGGNSPDAFMEMFGSMVRVDPAG